MLKSKYALVIVIFIALAMVMSSMALIGGIAAGSSSSEHTNTPGSLVVSHNANPILTGKAAQVMKALAEKGIPANYVYLPNFNAAVHKKDGIIMPSYDTAPAPMGIGAYGISNSTGNNLTTYNLTTSSVMASLNVSSLQDFYALDDGPNSVTFQLNAVLHNVALFGNSSYAFWTQNVVFYSARNQSLELLDNLWNFSSSSFTLTQNSLYSYNGTPVAPEYYYAVGPTFHVTYPFSLNLYLNTSVIDGRSTVFYNYSLETSGKSYSGSYDRIIFNSTSASNPSYSAPAPQYLISGNTYTPDGYIPYDAEIMIGGPGGGSTANILNINATMQLKYMTNGTTPTYTIFPDTFDVGSQTGETSQGVAVSWSSNDVAKLTAGPSYVYGMWGLNPAGKKMYSYSGTVNPPNSFMFTSPGAIFNATLSAWVPLNNSGHYSFIIPYGSLAYNVMLSDHEPVVSTMGPGTGGTISLSANETLGIYTPLYAMDNAQLKYISSSGDGSRSNPYVIYNNPSANGYINPLFGELNDYAFPAFSGLLLHNVSAYTLVSSEPSFTVNYSENVFSYLITSYFGLPSTNNLGIVLYNTSNATVRDNKITGWFSFEQTEFPVANLLLWNSQNNFITKNIFITMDSSMLVYNTHTEYGNNSILGNLFIQSSQLNANNYALISVSTTFGTSPYGPVALTMYSSGNSVSENYFIVYNTAISPNYSIYSGNNVNYNDTWNSNFWWNYVDRSGPYNNNGQITSGYDYSPIIIHGFERFHLRLLVEDFKHR